MIKSGIYQIRNLVNGKIYIGSTKYFPGRKTGHFGLLKKDKHPNKHLQKSFNKHSFKNFVFEILFTCPESELLRLEQYHLDNYNPEYNFLKVAGSNRGTKRSEETKRKMSESRKGYRPSEKEKEKIRNTKRLKGTNLKPVYKIDMNTGEILDFYVSLKEAAELNNMKKTSISSHIGGFSKHSGGFIWRFVNNQIQS